MKTSPAFVIRRSTIDDAPLFYDVIDKTMREFIITTWGRWNEDRVRQESIEDIAILIEFLRKMVPIDLGKIKI
jgi:hypothetical protein